jgi:hypothetical protein
VLEYHLLSFFGWVNVLQANTMAQMVRAMRAIMSMESLGNSSLAATTSQSREDEKRTPELSFRQSTSEEDIDALEVQLSFHHSLGQASVDVNLH